MASIQIKYVGLKQDGEEAFQDRTGITWYPGTVQPVSEAHAVVMLQHPDVFARADGETVAAGDVHGPATVLGDTTTGNAEGSSDPFNDPTFLGTGAQVGKNAQREADDGAGDAGDKSDGAADDSTISLSPGTTVSDAAPAPAGKKAKAK